MAEPSPISVAFPTGGVSKSHGFLLQDDGTTPSALNVWPRDYPGGRDRGGTRPGLESVNSPGGTPYNWARAEYTGGQGVICTTSTGTHLLETAGGSWSSRITQAPGGNFSSCVAYQQSVYQASSSKKFVRVNLLDGSGTEGNLTDIGDGTVPKYCGLISVHGDRLVMAGDANNPQVVYMSHIGTANDWDYSKETRSAAWANAGGEEGRIGEIITSLISHNRSCMLVGCTDSLYVIRGNPIANNNPIDTLSHEVGPLMQSAWCKTDNDYTVMLTRQGLYAMPPGCGDVMENISDGKLPDDLVGIDPGAGDTVSLVHDARFRGVHILINYNAGGGAYYFFDLKPGGGFWPMEYEFGDMRLGLSFKRSASSTLSDVHLLKSVGGQYQYDTDSTEEFDSHLYYGPLAIGSPHTEGILTELSAVLAEDSGDISWEVYAGKSPQEAFNGTALFTGNTWDIQGLNFRAHPRVRGVAAYLKVFATGTTRWSIEEVVATAYARARRRVG